MHDDEAPRPMWNAGGTLVTAALARFTDLGFDDEAAGELVTTTARVLAEGLARARSVDDVVGAMRSAIKLASHAVRSVREDREHRALPVLQAACARGCAHCCTLHVSISAPEAIVLGAFLRDTTAPDVLAALRAKLEAFARAVRPLDQAARVRAKLACPLLVDGACSVYPVRPLVCAGASSLDAQACARALDDPESGIPIEPIVHGVMRAMQLGLATAISARALDVGRYELSGALVIALAPTAASRWLAGERIFSRSEADAATETIARTAQAFVARDPHLPRGRRKTKK